MEREANLVLKVLTDSGHEAYIVGGYVRDFVLGRDVKDIDIATSAAPEQVMERFAKTVPTGLQHGTVTVISNGYAFEVTTFRKESEYEGFRRPKEVEFVRNLEEDLQRRDFTMNAMALDQERRLIDPFGGKADMERGILRAVGEPSERFREDALRMLRCIRFAAEYGLEVEPRTWAALLEHAPLLQHIAMERVRMELERMVEGSHPLLALRMLAASGLLRHAKAPLALPELPAELEALEQLAAPQLRWALLLRAQRMNAQDASRVLRQLTFSRTKWENVSAVLALDAELGQAQPSVTAWKRAAVRYGVETAKAWLSMEQAVRAVVPDESVYLQHGAAWLEEMPAASVKELAVSGSDLVRALGGKPGPWLGRMMAELLDRVALGELQNDTASLIEAAKTMEVQSPHE